MVIKAWIELTLHDLADDILQSRSIEEIQMILSKYAEEIYSVIKESEKTIKG